MTTITKRALSIALLSILTLGTAARVGAQACPVDVPATDVSTADAPTDAPADAPAEATTAPTDEARPPRVKFHAVGLAFHTTMFAADNRYGYTLMGPAVTYQYFVGRRWGFALRGEMYFPASARYAGPEADFRTGLREPYDSRRIGLDGMVLAARRFTPSPSLVVLTGVGLHVQSFKLSGAQYAPLEGITGGIGGFARLDWRVTRVLSLGGDIALAIDPIDFVRHQNRAVVTVPLSIGASLGLSY